MLQKKQCLVTLCAKCVLAGRVGKCGYEYLMVSEAELCVCGTGVFTMSGFDSDDNGILRDGGISGQKNFKN